MKAKIILWVFIITYILYFSYYSVLRYKSLNGSYYDLGIMHQTVYNSYKAIQTGDWSRFLELTNPTGTSQIKRMAIHNDMILGLLSILYFISATPTMLVVFQTIVLGFGGWYIFHIAQIVFKNQRFKDLISLLFTFCFLMYVPMQRSNMFDFHAVVLSTTLLLGFFYYWLVGKKKISLYILILALLTKEQIGFTTMLVGAYMFVVEYQGLSGRNKKKLDLHVVIEDCWFPLMVIAMSLAWSLISFLIIIPLFRGGEHFAVERYDQFGDSTGAIVKTLLLQPKSIFVHLTSVNALDYIRDLLSSLSFLSLFSPLHLLLALPDLTINLLSKNGNMRNIFFHYTAVIQPFVFISAIYGLSFITTFLHKVFVKKNKRFTTYITLAILFLVLVSTLWFSYQRSPLFYSQQREVFSTPLQQHDEVLYAKKWARLLQSDMIKVSTTGHLAPYFTSRRFFYDFSVNGYRQSDFVLVSRFEIDHSFDAEKYIKAYNALRSDQMFSKIEVQGDIEVYQKN